MTLTYLYVENRLLLEFILKLTHTIIDFWNVPDKKELHYTSKLFNWLQSNKYYYVKNITGELQLSINKKLVCTTNTSSK